MKSLLVLLILIPTLSWGLTFKNGKQISESEKVLITSDVEVKNKNLLYTISKPGIVYIEKKYFIENLIKNSNHIKCYYKALIFPKIDIKVQDQHSFTAHDVIESIGRNMLERWCHDQISNSKILNPIENNNLKLKEYFLELENSKYLLKFPRPLDDIQFAYEIGRFLPSLLFTYSLMRDEFTEAEKQKIDKMFKDLVNKYQYVWNISNSGKANKGLYFNNFSLLTAIIINDEKLFNQSIKKFIQIMKFNTTETGFMKKDGKRGECGLSYNLHALTPIMSTLWNLKLQGVDLTKEKLSHNHNMDEIVFAILDIANNPQKLKDFQKKYGLSKSIGSQKSCYQWMNISEFETYYNKEFDIIMPFHGSGWFYAYKALSPNPDLNLKLFNQVNNLKFNIDKKSGDSNTIGVFPIAIYQ